MLGLDQAWPEAGMETFIRKEHENGSDFIKWQVEEKSVNPKNGWEVSHGLAPEATQFSGMLVKV